MTEEEYFRKNYPDSCYGNKPLSPYWDFFQDGVEFGERESEKKIAELEQENKVLTQNLEDTEIVNKALEKENAELKRLVNQYKASKCGSISLVNRNMIMFDQLA